MNNHRLSPGLLPVLLLSVAATAGALGCGASMPVSAAVGASPSDSPLAVPASLSVHAGSGSVDAASGAQEGGAGHDLKAHAPGELHVGVVAVEGGDVEDAARVAADLEGDLQRCSAKRTESAFDLELQVHAKIGPNGEVRYARSTGTDDLGGALAACVTGWVQTAQFAPPRGQDPTVVIPIAYRN